MRSVGAGRVPGVPAMWGDRPALDPGRLPVLALLRLLAHFIGDLRAVFACQKLTLAIDQAAILICSNAVKGRSALQLGRDLDVQ